MNKNIILLGPPAAGKSTLSRELKKEFDIPHISIGSVLRKEIEKDAELKILVEPYMKIGALIPDPIVIKIVEKNLLKQKCQNGFILDGFPRTLPQAKLFEDLCERNNIKIDTVLHVNISDENVLKRSEARRHCGDCGVHYNLFDNPPIGNDCDACHGELVKRPDDTIDIIMKRLKDYHDLTEPVVEYFKEKGLVKTFEKNSPSEFAKQVKEFLRSDRKVNFSDTFATRLLAKSFINSQNLEIA